MDGQPGGRGVPSHRPMCCSSQVTVAGLVNDQLHPEQRLAEFAVDVRIQICICACVTVRACAQHRASACACCGGVRVHLRCVCGMCPFAGVRMRVCALSVRVCACAMFAIMCFSCQRAFGSS